MNIHFKMTIKFKTLLTQIAFSLIAQLSLKNCHRLGSVLGWLYLMIPNRASHVTKINIKLCFPHFSSNQQQSLIKKSLIATAKTLVEASPMWLWKKDKLFKFIKNVQGKELIDNALSKGKGVILALPHLGNWELLSLYCSDEYTTTTMYQKPKMEQLDAIVKKGRERFGSNLVPADNVGVRAMYKALKNNECICILPDQEPSTGNGVFAPFFDVNAYSMTLVSRLTKKTNATVITAYAKRLEHGQGYEIIFTDAQNMSEKVKSDIENESIAYLNSEIEKCIRDIPEQYQWSYKRFRTQPLDENKKPINDFYNG